MWCKLLNIHPYCPSVKNEIKFKLTEEKINLIKQQLEKNNISHTDILLNKHNQMMEKKL